MSDDSGQDYRDRRNNLYGSLFFHVRDLLRSFVRKLKAMPATVHFHLTCCDAGELAKKLAERHIVLDRVDVSNACDHNYMGIAPVLHDWGPLLRRARAEEERGVLLTTFMNWYQAVPGLDPGSGMSDRNIAKAMPAFQASRAFQREASGASADLFGTGSEMLELIKRHHDSFPAFKSYLQDQGAFRRKKAGPGDAGKEQDPAASLLCATWR
eukprot:jgi/Mesen1/798/ME000110S_11068